MRVVAVEITELALQQAKALTGRLLQSSAVSHRIPPFFARDYAPLLGISRIERVDLGNVDALLFPGQEGYCVKLNSKHHFNRQNFSLAHEIGHLLVDRMLNECSSGAVELRSSKEADPGEIERLCNRIAAELLMPESLFGPALSSHGVSVSAIEPLSSIFRTSATATARRIVEVSKELCIVLYWELAGRPTPRETKPYLIWSEAPESTYDIPKRISVSPKSSVFCAFGSQSALAEFESFPLGNVPRPFYIESKAFGQKLKRYVISLVFPQRRKPRLRRP